MGALGGAISGAGAKNVTNIAKNLTPLGGLSKGFVDSAISIGKNGLALLTIDKLVKVVFVKTNIFSIASAFLNGKIDNR